MDGRIIHTEGLTFIEPVPGGSSAWYYGLGDSHGDLYEAEEIFRDGGQVKGNDLCLIRYPEGDVYRPVPGRAGTCFGTPVFLKDQIYILNVDFEGGRIRIFRFDCTSCETGLQTELPLDAVRNCYNLMLHIEPLSLTRQGNEGMFEIIWPERVCFEMEPHESFFLRQGDRLYFSRWHEEGEGPSYRYWEDTVIRSLRGDVIETFPGDVRVMPNGELWYLK